MTFRKLSFLLAFLLALVSCSSQPKASADDDVLGDMYAQYGSDLVSALASLPETRERFANILERESWEFSVDTGTNISAPDKVRALEGLSTFVAELPEDDRKSLVKRIENWIHVRHVIDHVGHVTFFEAIMAASYLSPSTSDLFDRIVKSRSHLGDNPDAIDVAATMASGEHYDILRHILNRLSASSDLEQATFFSHLYGALVNDKKLRDWAFDE